MYSAPTPPYYYHCTARQHCHSAHRRQDWRNSRRQATGLLRSCRLGRQLRQPPCCLVLGTVLGTAIAERGERGKRGKRGERGESGERGKRGARLRPHAPRGPHVREAAEHGARVGEGAARLRGDEARAREQQPGWQQQRGGFVIGQALL